MEIKLPENPSLYLILIGFFLIGYILISTSGNQKDWLDFVLVFFGSVFFVLGWNGLEKNQILMNRKVTKEIELLEAKTKKTENEVLFGNR